MKHFLKRTWAAAVFVAGVAWVSAGADGSGPSLEARQRLDEAPATLRVLAAQMGVGGDDSWMSPVHEQYQLPADQPLSLNVQLKLF